MSVHPHAHSFSYVLVTGATGFIGAHVLDELLRRGLKVRVAVRNFSKANLLLDARPDYADKLDFVQIADFTETTSFEEAVKNVDGIVHVASVSDECSARRESFPTLHIE